jgi:hypothetical protein
VLHMAFGLVLRRLSGGRLFALSIKMNPVHPKNSGLVLTHTSHGRMRRQAYCDTRHLNFPYKPYLTNANISL